MIKSLKLTLQIRYFLIWFNRSLPFYSSLGQSDVVLDESPELRNSARPGFTGSGHRKQRESVLTKLKIMTMISANPLEIVSSMMGGGY